MAPSELPGRAEVLRGPGILEQLGDELDVLASACAVPVTARRAWLQCWSRTQPEWEQVAVLVRSGGALSAAALLGARRRVWGWSVVAMGHGACDRSRLYAVDQTAARELAHALASWLRTLPGSWRLRLTQLPVGDPVTAALVGILQHARVQDAVGSPCVAFGEDRSVASYFHGGARGQSKNKWNRMVKRGLEPRIETTRDPDAITQLLPRLMEIAAVRQQQLTGRRKLDDGRQAAFFREVITGHARRGEVEVALLRLGGDIGAYTVTFLDGDTARMWINHYDPHWSEFSPGHLLAGALIERCLELPGIQALDWMLGMEPYKLRYANRIDEMATLDACSGRAARVALAAARELRTRAQALRAAHPVLRRLQVATRRILAGGTALHRRSDGA